MLQRTSLQTRNRPLFHTTRRVAMEMGFKVGWHPLEADKPISVGSGGDINPGMVQ